MQALKIVAEGSLTSFRYPHFAQGVHLTYEMPPPATIYGHVCSAVGEFIPPQQTQFAYHFIYDAKVFDYEHLHFFGKEPKMNPFNRELLFNPTLTLYLSDTSLEPYFRNPRYPVVLGRSQDLMTYTKVEVITLEKADHAYYTNTILDLKAAREIGGRTYSATMPAFINPERQATWQQYAILHGLQEYPAPDGLRFETDFEIWVDPTEKHPYKKDLYRGVVWHQW